MAPWSEVNVFVTIAMCVLYGLLGPSNVDMSARALQYGYCQCAWQTWCWEKNRDCWACASAWSAGFAQGEAASAAAAAAAAQRAIGDEAEAAAAQEEMLAQWEADLNLAEAAAAASAAREEARAEETQEKARLRRLRKRSESKSEGSGGGAAQKKSRYDPQTGATLSWTTR